MSMLATWFAAWMRKCVSDSEDESTPVFLWEASKAVFYILRGLEGLGNNSSGLPRLSYQ